MGKKYKIGELAKVAGVSPKAIRIYEEKGMLVSFRDKLNNYRYFTEESVVRMQRIQMLKYLGFSLDAIGNMLLHYEKMDMTDTFLEQKRMLEKKAEELDRMIYCMDRAARECQKDDFRMVKLFESLNTIIVSRTADEQLWKIGSHSDEPRGWARWTFDQSLITPGQHILDAGCGWGNLWRCNEDRLSGDIDVTLVDFHNTYADDLSEYIRGKSQFHFIWGDLNEIDYPGKYDLIFFNHLQFYIKDKISTYQKLKSILTKDGKFIATWGGIELFEKVAAILIDFLPSEKRKIEDGLKKYQDLMYEWESELKNVFHQAEKRVYPITLSFNNEREMADYLETFASKLGVELRDYMPHFEDYLKCRFGDEGYSIGRDTYLYICR